MHRAPLVVGLLLFAASLVASSPDAHAGPEDIPPPGQTTSTPELKPEPEPAASSTSESQSTTTNDERFHVEAAFLMSPLYDVVIDYDDQYVHAGSRNGHGLAFGGEGAISFRLSRAFHLGIGARLQTSSRGGPVRGNLLHVPVRLAWVMPIVADSAWMSYGIGAGFARAWITPSGQLPDGNASNGFGAEARIAFIKRLFAKVDGVVSLTGWIGPLTSNAFGSSGLTLGLGFRFGA